MANFNEQVLRAWDEWEATTGEDANNPDDFVAWALNNKKLAPQIQEIRKLLRRQVTGALRQALRTDEDRLTYRAKQCVKIIQNGSQIAIWFDIDRGGTSSLRQKAVRQRRDGIAHHVYRGLCDVERMRKLFPEEQLSFQLDYTDDCAELRAAELMGQRLRGDDEDDDDEAAAA